MKQDYRIYTKILRKVIKNAKFKFENEIVRTYNQNAKKLLEIIKSRIGKNSLQGNTINHISVNNQTIDKKSDIANAMFTE